MSHTHPMYVCDRCNFGHYHPLSYCPRCPGRLHRTDVPHPMIFETEKQQVEYLKGRGVEYIGEYPNIDEITQLEIQLQRYEENEKQARGELEACHGNAELRKRLERRTESWRRNVEEIRCKLNEARRHDPRDESRL